MSGTGFPAATEAMRGQDVTITQNFIATLTGGERLANSVDGNPRWRVQYVDDGGKLGTMDTLDDADVGFQLLNWLSDDIRDHAKGKVFRFHYLDGRRKRITRMEWLP